MRTVATLLGLVLMFAACSGGGQQAPTDASASSKIAFDLLVKKQNDPDPDVLSSADTEIYVVNPDGSDSRRLTHNFLGDGVVRWSPDGKQLAEVADDGDLYVLRADGSQPSRLTGPIGLLPPDWSPDGTRLVFTGEPASGVSNLWSIGSDGEELVNLPVAGVRPHFISSSVLRPDGTKIAFIGFHRTGRKQRAGLYVVAPEGGETVKLAASGGLGDPHWSPDGTRIAFRRDPPQPGLYVINADGTGLRRLTEGRWDQEAEWSPDGSKIAFTRYRQDFDVTGTLYVVDVSTGALYAPVPDLGTYEPTWSPDGTKIAFIGPVSGRREPGSDAGEIYVVNMEGGPPQIITHTGGNASSPVWSPGPA
jgi:Tol biopolymer transport system component